MDRNTQSFIIIALCAGCIILGFNVWSLKKMNNSLEGEKIEFALQTSAKSREVGSKEEVIITLTGQLDSQKSQNVKLQKEKKTIGDKVSILEQGVKKKTAEISTLKKNLDQVKAGNKNLDSKLNEEIKKNKMQEEEIEKNRKQEEEINNKNVEIENLQNIIRSKEAEIENLGNEIASKVDEHETLKNEIVSKLIPRTESYIESVDSNDQEEVRAEEENITNSMERSTMESSTATSSFFDNNGSGSSYISSQSN